MISQEDEQSGFIALADPKRREILQFLREGAAQGVTIAEYLGLRGSDIGKDLQRLQRARFILAKLNKNDFRSKIYRRNEAVLFAFGNKIEKQFQLPAKKTITPLQLSEREEQEKFQTLRSETRRQILQILQIQPVNLAGIRRKIQREFKKDLDDAGVLRHVVVLMNSGFASREEGQFLYQYCERESRDFFYNVVTEFLLPKQRT